MSLYQIHCNYLRRFGTERMREFCITVGKLCLKNGWEYPYEKDQTLEEFLEDHQLWYLLYL